jgi:hypothetical protein
VPSRLLSEPSLVKMYHIPDIEESFARCYLDAICLDMGFKADPQLLDAIRKKSSSLRQNLQNLEWLLRTTSSDAVADDADSDEASSEPSLDDLARNADNVACSDIMTTLFLTSMEPTLAPLPFEQASTDIFYRDEYRDNVLCMDDESPRPSYADWAFAQRLQGDIITERPGREESQSKPQEYAECHDVSFD